MNQRLKTFLRDPNVRWTFVAALITAAAAYGYGMLNNIVNYDSIYNIPYIGSGTERSGRWALGLLTRLTQRLHLGYSIPFFNLLVSLVLLAFSAVLLCKLLRLTSRTAWVLTGIVTLSFPAVASMTFFSYTMVYYALAFLLIVAATLLTERMRKPLWFLAYSLLLAFSIGVYQAFYPFAVMLAVLAVLAECLDPEATPLDGTTLTNYQGIDRMGVVSLSRLPGMLKEIYANFYLLFTHDYLSLTAEPISRLCVLLLLLLSVGMLALGWREKRLWKQVELAGLLLAALPVASNLIIVMVPDGTVYTLMAMGLLSVFLLPLLLWDRLPLPRPRLRRICGGVLAAVLVLSSLEYVYLINGCYRVLEWHNIQTENYYVTMFTRIKSLEGYDETYPVVFAGSVITDASYEDLWADTVFSYGGLRQFDSKDPENNGFNEFSRDRFIRSYLGYTARKIHSEERIRYAEVLDGMRTYPNDGSIRIVDGLILVKFE